MTKPPYIITGKVGVAYGIKGWVKIHSFTEIASEILQYQPWYLAENDQWQAVTIEEGRPHGKGVVVKFPGVETPEAARLLSGREIAIKREQLAALPADEYYWTDLEGLTVINEKGENLGQVAYLIATGANDVLVVKDAQGKEHAIPYLPQSVVKQVDLLKQTIIVDWDLL